MTGPAQPDEPAQPAEAAAARAFTAADIPDELVAAVRSGRWVPLVGAGFSRQSSKSVYSWPGLLDRLRAICVEREYLEQGESDELGELTKGGHYLLVAQHVKAKLGTDYVEEMRRIYQPAPKLNPSDAHRALLRLRPRLMLTTNYDRLLEDAVAEELRLHAVSHSYRNSGDVASWIQRGEPEDQPLIFKLHGDIIDPNTLVLTESDYRRLLFTETGYRMVLSAIFLTRTVLMLGFSADDPELRLLLASHREALDYHGTTDFALMALPAGSVKADRLRNDFGVRVIRYDEVDDNHPEVKDFLEVLAELAGHPAAADGDVGGGLQ